MIVPPPPNFRKVRKHLSADALYALVRGSFAGVPDPRRSTSAISLVDPQEIGQARQRRGEVFLARRTSASARLFPTPNR